MSGLEIVLFLLALIVMLVGLVGTVLPGIPGVPLIFLAAVLYGWLTDFAAINSDTLWLFGILTVISLVLDWLSAAFGVRKMGGTYFGVLGAFLGMIVVLFLPGVGLVAVNRLTKSKRKNQRLRTQNEHVGLHRQS